MVISREQDTKHTYEHGNKCVWVWKKYIYLFCLFIYFLHFFFLFLVLIFFVNSPAKSTNSNIIKYSFFEFAAVRALESSVWLTESVDLACIVVSTLCLCLSVVSVFVSVWVHVLASLLLMCASAFVQESAFTLINEHYHLTFARAGFTGKHAMILTAVLSRKCACSPKLFANVQQAHVA